MTIAATGIDTAGLAEPPANHSPAGADVPGRSGALPKRRS